MSLALHDEAMVTHLAAADGSAAAWSAMLAACCLADLKNTTNESEEADA